MSDTYTDRIMYGADCECVSLSPPVRKILDAMDFCQAKYIINQTNKCHAVISYMWGVSCISGKFTAFQNLWLREGKLLTTYDAINGKDATLSNK